MTRISSLSSVLLFLMVVGLCISNARASGKSPQSCKTCKKCPSECKTKECKCQDRKCKCRTCASKCKTQKCWLKKCESEKCETKHAEKPKCSSSVVEGPFGRVDFQAAWLWMKFPKGKNPSVSVNFTEYPPAGNFRIFRTKVPCDGKRRYYISAAYLEGEERIALKPSKFDRGVKPDGLTGQWYVDLAAGETVKILFTEDQESSSDGTGNGATPSAELGKVRADLAGRIQRSEDQLREDIARLESKIEKLKPRLESPSRIPENLPTMRFRFSETETKMVAAITLDGNGNVNDVDITKHPVDLTIKVPHWPTELGAQLLKGELYLAVFNGDQQPAIQPLFLLPKAVSVQFRTPAGPCVADVPFKQLRSPLSEGIKKLKPMPTKLLVRGFLRFTLNNGHKTIYGPLGNQIELSLKDVQ